MSASLVGSEMCIRDRPRSSRGDRAAGACCDRAGGARGRRGPGGLGAGTCLLYTSDAADDM
eukprot:6790692-Alexandrium_andersonii.AAC.1